MPKSLQELNAKYIDSGFFSILEKKYRDLSDEELLKEFEFEQELNLFDNVQEIQDELLQETQNIVISLHTKEAIKKYFQEIEAHIEKRARYKNNKNKLDYRLIRRFLWTSFNNLYELDLTIITEEILHLSNSLREFAKIYNDFTRKTKYPSLAYDEVFLEKQLAYISMKKSNEKIVDEIKKLKFSEHYLEAILKKKKEKLEKEKKSKEYPKLLEEYRRVNGAYSDTIYICSVLREKYEENKKEMAIFERRYRAEFNQYFQKTATVYERVFLDILGAMAFEFDRILWEQAKKSPAIQTLFKEAQISGEYNAKTYLKYYLKTNKQDSSSEEMQELLDLYQYLNSLYMESILIVTDRADDAIEYKKSVKAVNKEQEVVSFTDEKLALKWAFQNNVKLLVVNEQLQNMTLSCFLQYYKKYSLSESQVLLLGNAKNLSCVITKQLPQGIMPHALAQEIEKLIDDKR